MSECSECGCTADRPCIEPATKFTCYLMASGVCSACWQRANMLTTTATATTPGAREAGSRLFAVPRDYAE